MIIFLFISTFLITLLNYFNILNYTITKYLKFIVIIISFFITGIKLGNQTNKKNFKEIIKFVLPIILLMIIYSLIVNKFNFQALIYYSILLLSSTIGSILTKTKK